MALSDRLGQATSALLSPKGEDVEERSESPEHVQLSLAAAMQLGFHPARFYRAARMTCINLLLTYSEGCAASCSYCGLARNRQVEREEARSFIRVPWFVKPIEEVLERITRSRVVQRTCLSMVTHRRSVADSVTLVRRITQSSQPPVSVLVSPTLVSRDDLVALREAGADRLGVAFDLPTDDLFDQHRGRGVGGPHRWGRYWQVFAEGVEVFGERRVGSHFVVGLGETEQQMTLAFQRVHDQGGVNHLFSFFPEAGSAAASRGMPPMDVYRRLQIACELIDSGLSRVEQMSFGAGERLVDFGVGPEVLKEVICSGEAFRTRGCEGPDGQVACNRPYANSLPGDDIRNFPFAPEEEDIARVRQQLGLGS